MTISGGGLIEQDAKGISGRVGRRMQRLESTQAFEQIGGEELSAEHVVLTLDALVGDGLHNEAVEPGAVVGDIGIEEHVAHPLIFRSGVKIPAMGCSKVEETQEVALGAQSKLAFSAAHRGLYAIGELHGSKSRDRCGENCREMAGGEFDETDAPMRAEGMKLALADYEHEKGSRSLWTDRRRATLTEDI